jgi:hypothetical protein
VAAWIAPQSRICPGQYLTDRKRLTVAEDESSFDAASKPAKLVLTRNNDWQSVSSELRACCFISCHRPVTHTVTHRVTD